MIYTKSGTNGYLSSYAHHVDLQITSRPVQLQWPCPQDIGSLILPPPAYPDLHQNWTYWLSGRKVISHTGIFMWEELLSNGLSLGLLENHYYRAKQVHINNIALPQLPQDGNTSIRTTVPPDPASTPSDTITTLVRKLFCTCATFLELNRCQWWV